MSNTKNIVTGGTSLTALVLMIVGIATPKWQTLSFSGGGQSASAYMGLWQGCGMGMGKTICEALTSEVVDATFWVIRILALLGALLTLVGSLLYRLRPQQRKYAKSLVAFAGVCSIASAVVWATDSKLKDGMPGSSFGYSWYLTLAGGVMALGTAGAEQFM